MNRPAATRSNPDRSVERAFRLRGHVVAGVDEVGRGAIAGPLVIAAVVMPAEHTIPRIRDSKLLSPARREVVAKAIREVAEVGIGVAEVDEINRRGLAACLRSAARRALNDLPSKPSHVLLDGNHDYIGKGYTVHTIVGGDQLEQCIAAASVVAKVHRDALMVDLTAKHPRYGFEWNKGYGTEKHREALEEFGACKLHRTSWKTFQQLSAKGLPTKPALVKPLTVK